MKALMVQQRNVVAIDEFVIVKMKETDRDKTDDLDAKAHSAIMLCLGDEVLREVTKEDFALKVWQKLESLYMKKSLANR